MGQMITIKKICGMMILCAVIAIMVSPDVMAGGGINWKVKVTNDTPYEIRVKIWVNELVKASEKETKWIAPGSSYTFATGALCPDKLGGAIFKDHSSFGTSLGTYCLGMGDWKESSDSRTGCSAACWNSTIRVVRMAPDHYEEFRDYDYGFKKL
jgi:hypothetical protein